MIKTKDSSKLNKAQIEKINNLLLNTIEGLKVENIKIIDTELIQEESQKSPVPEVTQVK